MARLTKTQKKRMLESIKSKAFKLSPMSMNLGPLSSHDFSKIVEIVNRASKKLK